MSQQRSRRPTKPDGCDASRPLKLRSVLGSLLGAGHVCSVYEGGQEYLDLLKAFVEVGIARGEKCVCVVSSGSEASLRESMRAASPRIGRALDAQAVVLTSIERAYSTHHGLLMQRAVDFWRDTGERAVAAGFAGIRGVIQTDRIPGNPAEHASWIDYENRLTQMLGERGGAMLCLYNRSVHSAELVRDALRAHAIVAYRGRVAENAFHVAPDEYDALDRAARESDRMLAGLCKHGRRKRVPRLVAGDLETATGSWAWNLATGALFWSREHFRIFGLDPAHANVSYRLFFQMIHPDERDQLEASFREAARAGRNFDGEYRIVGLDGVVKHIHSRAYPVFAESGELTEYVGTVADITERRQGEESLGELQADLAHAARAIAFRELMASIAHEVNQPLAAVIANANAAMRWLAAGVPRIDKAQQALSRIVRDGNRATQVIARIRSLVKISGAERTELDLNSIVREVFVLLRTELRRNNITVRADLEGNLPPIQGDRVHLQQVLLNLITNAIEAMSAVRTRPRLLAIATAADDGAVTLTIQDSGSGLGEQMLERVFEPFYTTKARGMGIGLAICRSIIEAHGGSLWAQRNTLAGATFQFRLPSEGAHAQ